MLSNAHVNALLCLSHDNTSLIYPHVYCLHFNEFFPLFLIFKFAIIASNNQDEWWLHVAGTAGSHVVIKSRDDELETKYGETLLDAATIAAHFSKGKNSNNIVPVHYTRCRSVKKVMFSVYPFNG